MKQTGLKPIAIYLLAALCVAPLIAVLIIAALPDKGSVSHMIEYTLSRYVINSVWLALGVGGLSMAIGACAAWYVTMYQFPLRRVIEWLLLLPLAMPSYISAMVYGHLLDAAGPLQDGFRQATGLGYHDYWFPDIRSLGGAVLVLSFSLYPYVYILARIAFRFQCASLFENARLLGCGSHGWFWKIALPVARPSLVVGGALVIMETLADYGTVSLFGVASFTTGIYRVWYGMGDPIAAAKIACVLLALVMLALWCERFSRRHMHFAVMPDYRSQIPRINSSAIGGLCRLFICAIPAMVGFVIPAIQLVAWASHKADSWYDTAHWHSMYYSVLIAALAAVVATLIALVFAYALRIWPTRAMRLSVRAATIGYAIPGSVIAVGVFIPMLLFDKTIANALELYSGHRPGLFITGSIAAIVMACVVRFLAVAFASVESGVGQIHHHIDDAARLLGASYGHIFRHLHLPHLKTSLLIAGFMVFTDTLKELPATLLLRPFNVETLAIRTYELAHDTRLYDAAIPALILVAISLMAVLVLATQHIGVRAPAITKAVSI